MRKGRAARGSICLFAVAFEEVIPACSMAGSAFRVSISIEYRVVSTFFSDDLALTSGWNTTPPSARIARIARIERVGRPRSICRNRVT
jgi:hypothetical protein